MVEYTRPDMNEILLAVNLFSYVILFVFYLHVRGRLNEEKDSSTTQLKISTQVTCRTISFVLVLMPLPFFIIYIGKFTQKPIPLLPYVISQMFSALSENLLLLLCVVSLIGILSVNKIWISQYGKRLFQ